MTALYDITNEALRLWVTVTGVDPDKDSFTLGDWNIRSINDRIRTAQDIDASGLTTFLFLRAVARDYVSQRTVNALELIESQEETLASLSDMRALITTLDDPRALEEVGTFQRMLRDMADEQGLLAQTAALIEDLSDIATIRLDALYGAETLRRDTFRFGARRAEHLRYNKRVLKFWNVNSLVRALEVQPEDGISMCLLRDPDVIEYSFFAFAMRDGDNVSVWSDVESQAHPLQKFMSRSRMRARRLEERAEALRFPYQLLDVVFDDEGKHARPDTSGTALVRTNIEAVAIAPLEMLPPDQILWSLMMFDLLRYQTHSEEVSMTGEAVFLALSGNRQKAIGPVEPLAAEHVTKAVICEQLQDTENRSDLPTGANDWMDERYSGRVNADLLNVFSSTREGVMRIGTSGALVKQGPEEGHLRTIEGLSPMAFGSVEEMEHDRVWIARYNQAKAVEKLAKEEFERRREEITAWYEKAVRKNLTFFVDGACRGRIEVPHGNRTFGSTDTSPTENAIRWQRFSKGEEPSHWSDAHSLTTSLYVPQPRHRGLRIPAKCIISGEIASVWTKFRPRMADTLKMFVGGAALPDVLQHWCSEAPYGGNSILSRTDPMDSMIEDPWRALKFEVILGLSVREFRRQCKARKIVHEERFQIWHKGDRYGGGGSYWAVPETDEE